MISEAAHSRPMRRDAVRNQQLVIDAARGVLSEFGEDATMELVASRAGVGVGTIYRHYPNKAALFEQLVRIIVGDLIEAAELALASEDGTGLAVFLAVLGRSLCDHRGYADKLMGYADDKHNQRLRGLIADLADQARVHEMVASTVTFDDVMATIAGLRGVITNRPTDSASPDAGWERHLAIHLAGLRTF